MMKVIQANCRASEDIMTAPMAATVTAGAEIVLLQEPSMKGEEDKWVANIRDGNYVYIHSDSGSRPYILTAVRKDIMWKDYGGSRGPETVGIEVGNCYTRINYIRTYYTQLLTKLQCYKRVTHEVTHCHDRVTYEVT
jgi:hypothetical protein